MQLTDLFGRLFSSCTDRRYIIKHPFLRCYYHVIIRQIWTESHQVAVYKRNVRSTSVDMRGSMLISPVRSEYHRWLTAGSECALSVRTRWSAYLSWRRLSIIVNKNASNDHNADKIVTALKKMAYKIAFEGFLCYNHAEKEKKHAA